MEILAQTTSDGIGALKISSVILGILAIYVAFKVVKMFLKLLFGVLGVALLGAAAWWFLLRG
jgi:hypothetical protein